MPRIILETKIDAPIYRVFDLARSIDLHKISFRDLREKVIAGRKQGLINEHEYVTWKGKPFLGIPQKLTSAITIMAGPYFFEDKMLKGPFAKLQHKHFFETASDDKTVMKDIFDYSVPFKPLGCIADKLFLRKYLERLLMKRNHLIKIYAENDEKWMQILNIY